MSEAPEHPLNPYARLFDPQHDAAEHAREVAAGMAIPYAAGLPVNPWPSDRDIAVYELRAARRLAREEDLNNHQTPKGPNNE